MEPGAPPPAGPLQGLITIPHPNFPAHAGTAKPTQHTKHMKSLSKLTGVLAALCGAIAVAAQGLLGDKSLYMAANTATAYYQYAVDTHKNQISRTNDAAITTRNLLYKEGTTAGVSVAVAGAGDRPLGTIDNTEVAIGKDQRVFLLGKKWTTKMVANGAMSIGDDAYGAAGGKIGELPASAGSYYKVGRLLTPAGADGDLVEVLSIEPQLVTVIAHGSTLAQTQAAMVGGATVVVLAS